MPEKTLTAPLSCLLGVMTLCLAATASGNGRAALENVLIPETIGEHRRRLEDAGFDGFTVWLRYFNFVSMIAFRP